MTLSLHKVHYDWKIMIFISSLSASGGAVDKSSY